MPYEVKIDFDGASKAWRRNKVKNGASFRYCCGHIKANGERCKGFPVRLSQAKHEKDLDKRRMIQVLGSGFCRHHSHLHP